MGKKKRTHHRRFGSDKVVFRKVTNKYMTSDEKKEAARQANRALKAELTGKQPEPEPQEVKTYGQVLRDRQQEAEEIRRRVTPLGKTFPEYMEEIQKRRRKVEGLRKNAK